MTNDAWGNQLKVNFASGILLFTTFVQNPSAEAMMKVSPASSERDTDFFWQGHGFWAERPSNVLQKIPAHKNARPLVKIHHLIFHLVLKRKNPAGIVHGKLPRLIQGNRVLGALKKGNAQKVFQFLKGAGKGRLLFILYAQMRIQNEMNLGVPLTSFGSGFPGFRAFALHCLRQRLTPPLQSLTQNYLGQKNRTPPWLRPCKNNVFFSSGYNIACIF